MARGIKKGKWDGIKHKPLIHSNSLHPPSVLKALCCLRSAAIPLLGHPLAAYVKSSNGVGYATCLRVSHVMQLFH